MINTRSIFLCGLLLCCTLLRLVSGYAIGDCSIDFSAWPETARQAEDSSDVSLFWSLLKEVHFNCTVVDIKRQVKRISAPMCRLYEPMQLLSICREALCKLHSKACSVDQCTAVRDTLLPQLQQQFPIMAASLYQHGAFEASVMHQVLRNVEKRRPGPLPRIEKQHVGLYDLSRLDWLYRPSFVLVIDVNRQLISRMTIAVANAASDAAAPTEAADAIIDYFDSLRAFFFYSLVGQNSDVTVSGSRINVVIGWDRSCYADAPIAAADMIATFCHSLKIDTRSLIAFDVNCVSHSSKTIRSTMGSVCSDMRMELAMKYQTEADFILFIDPTLQIFTPNWLMVAIYRLFHLSYLIEDVGVAALDCSLPMQLDDERLMMPQIIAMSVTHLRIFSDARCPWQMSWALQDLLTLEMYHRIHSFECFNLAYRMTSPLSVSYTVAQLSIVELDEYVSCFQLQMRVLLRYLQEWYSYLDWQVSDALYNHHNVLYSRYCRASFGCIEHLHHSTASINASSENAAVVSLRDRHRSIFPMHRKRNTHVRIAFVTAVFGDYEASCKPYALPSIATDFICFTDNPNLSHCDGMWDIVTTPYHHIISIDEEHRRNLTTETNAFHRNNHSFNIAKFYKVSFHRIDLLRKYDAVVWIDATLVLHNWRASELLLYRMDVRQDNFIVFEHIRNGCLREEAIMASTDCRYNCTEWGGQQQPSQDVMAQYVNYTLQWPLITRDDIMSCNDSLVDQSLTRHDGDGRYPRRAQDGVWFTCLLALDMRSVDTHRFLDKWSDHVRKYTTQDQLSFPLVAKILRIHPTTLPDAPSQLLAAGDAEDRGVYGMYSCNTIFIKVRHGL